MTEQLLVQMFLVGLLVKNSAFNLLQICTSFAVMYWVKVLAHLSKFVASALQERSML